MPCSIFFRKTLNCNKLSLHQPIIDCFIGMTIVKDSIAKGGYRRQLFSCSADPDLWPLFGQQEIGTYIFLRCTVTLDEIIRQQVCHNDTHPISSNWMVKLNLFRLWCFSLYATKHRWPIKPACWLRALDRESRCSERISHDRLASKSNVLS